MLGIRVLIKIDLSSWLKIVITAARINSFL